MNRLHFIVAAVAFGGAPLVAGAQSAAPSTPAATAAASPAPRATSNAAAAYGERSHRVHRAIATCDNAAFYSWPSWSGAPTPSTYPPARLGDAFDVIGDGTLAYNGLTLYETTIDVLHPYGAGKHYWISARCVNAG